MKRQPVAIKDSRKARAAIAATLRDYCGPGGPLVSRLTAEERQILAEEILSALGARQS